MNLAEIAEYRALLRAQAAEARSERRGLSSIVRGLLAPEPRSRPPGPEAPSAVPLISPEAELVLAEPAAGLEAAPPDAPSATPEGMPEIAAPLTRRSPLFGRREDQPAQPLSEVESPPEPPAHVAPEPERPQRLMLQARAETLAETPYHPIDLVDDEPPRPSLRRRGAAAPLSASQRLLAGLQATIEAERADLLNRLAAVRAV